MTEWTFETLKAYVDARFDGHDRLYDERKAAAQDAITAALASVKEAMTKAETANERRFESVNEFRQTLTDQAATFATRDQFDMLRTEKDMRSGSSTSTKEMVAYIIGASGIVVGIVTFITRGAT